MPTAPDLSDRLEELAETGDYRAYAELYLELYDERPDLADPAAIKDLRRLAIVTFFRYAVAGGERIERERLDVEGLAAIIAQLKRGSYLQVKNGAVSAFDCLAQVQHRLNEVEGDPVSLAPLYALVEGTPIPVEHRWEIARAGIGYSAVHHLTQDRPGADLSDTMADLAETKHSGSTDLGYTYTALTLRGLRRKIARHEEREGFSGVQVIV